MPALQLLGLAIIALLPALAILGVFGPSAGEARAVTEDLELHVRYPTRVRLNLAERIEVRIRNPGPHPLENVTVTFSADYLAGFSQLLFTPPLSSAYHLNVGPIAPGRSALITAELRGEEFGVYQGEVAASTDRGRTAVALRTTVFP